MRQTSSLVIGSAVVLPLLALAAGGGVRASLKPSRFLHQPDLGPEAIVFVSGDDLWTAPLEGGKARRLTSQTGRESNPRFSPDGSQVAFSGEQGGNVDVYVILAAGGGLRRLTYHPADDRVQGWSPDGKTILFSSERESDHSLPRLHTIAASGGHPETLPMHKAFRGAFSPDGKRLAYTPIRDAFLTWKRYRGGETPPIWLVDLADYSHVEIPHENASDTSPVWMGDTVFFLSDRNGVMSLFGYDVGAGELAELYRNGWTDIDALAGGNGRLVLSSGGYVQLYDVRRRQAHTVPITVEDDRAETAARIKNVAEEIRSAGLSPDGSQVVLEAHGELLTVPAHGGAFRNLTGSPGVAERHPAWSPDATKVAYFADEDGEYALYVRDAAGGPATRLGQGEPGLGYRTRWSPDGKRVAYVDRFQRLWYADLASGRHQQVLEARVDPDDPYRWSPDGRLIAFADLKPTRFRTLTLFDVESVKSLAVTDGMGDAQRPVFARDGRSVFFLGSTSAGKVKTGLDLSVIAHQNDVAWSVYSVRLSQGPGAAMGMPAERTGLERQIEKLSVPEGRYVDLQLAADGALLLTEDPWEKTFGGKRRLRRFDLEARKLDDLVENVDAFEIAANGKTLLYRSEKTWSVMEVASKPEAGGARALDTAQLEVRVDPRLEWRQMFLEGWRNQRDSFYDEALHGVDWRAMRERYAAYLPDMRYRSDLTFVLRHLVGELVNSHISVEGPRPHVERVPVGLLGADYEVVGDRYRVKRIVRGTYWDAEASPLAAPGVEVQEGDYILEVDGRELRHPTSIDSLFVGVVGRPVTLRVCAEPRMQGSRLVTVLPMESEASLRQRDWIERNRKKVDALSSGRIAYVYQPNTSQDSLREFDRYFFPQSDRAAVIIDERFNDGGDDPDYQLDVLDRQQVHWYRERGTPPFKSPFSIVAGPKVMLVNAEARSGGDVYPYQFKIRRLGTTVGTRTWGGVQGGGAGAQLIDGGFVGVPNLGTYAPDGSYILENSGFIPDVEVQVFPKDDVAGRDPQLERAVEIILEELRRQLPKPVPTLEKVDRSLKRSSREPDASSTNTRERPARASAGR